MSKKVYSIEGLDGDKRLLAVFQPDGKADYKDLDYKADLDINGIYLAGEGALYPHDGQAFYDALSRAYANSTYIEVIEA